jgi:hypothetical protein
MKKLNSHFRALPWFMAVLVSVFMVACGGGGGGQDPALLSIAVTPSTATIPSSGVQPFVATATYADASTRDVTKLVSWTSTAVGIATVVPATGVATGVSGGASQITANFDGKTGSATLTVTAATLVSLAVTPGTAILPVSGVQPFVATASFSDGSTRDVTEFSVWTTGTPGVATILQTRGVATGVANGVSSITADYSGKTHSATLTVNASLSLVSIAVSPNTAVVKTGSTQAFTANGTYSDGSVSDLTTTAVWTSASPLIAPVGAASGVATGAAVGSTVITATSSGRVGSATLNVSALESATGPAAVNLGTAGNFVILAKSGISTTGTTAIVGDLGVSPSAASFITGFGLITDATNTFSTSSLVSGKVYAADYTAPTPANMTTAISNMQTAFTDAAGRSNPDFTELHAGDITSKTLVPGLYKWGTGVLVGSAGVTLSGGPNAVWIFQISQDLTVSNGATVFLSGGAQAKNVFWQVSGKGTLGTGSTFNGNLLSQTLISLSTGATVTGRLLAQTAVTLDAVHITAP